MNNSKAIEILMELWRYKNTDKYTEKEIREALEIAIKTLGKGALRMTDKERKLALYCLKASSDYHSEVCEECINTETIIKALEQEPLTDTEKRIFLAAMTREEHVCKQVDKEFKDGEKLVPVCRSIKRKIINSVWV